MVVVPPSNVMLPVTFVPVLPAPCARPRIFTTPLVDRLPPRVTAVRTLFVPFESVALRLICPPALASNVFVPDVTRLRSPKKLTVALLVVTLAPAMDRYVPSS